MPDRAPTSSDDASSADDRVRMTDLEKRLSERLAERAERERPGRHAPVGALGVALRMSVELVVAVFVGGALGLGLDRVLDTGPWIMLIGFGFGFAAGVRSVVRTAEDMSGRGSSGRTDESN